MLRRVIAPDCGIEWYPIFLSRARLADFRMRKDPMTAIQPAVRPPDKRVERFVRVLIPKTIQQNLGLAVGPVVAVGGKGVGPLAAACEDVPAGPSARLGRTCTGEELAESINKETPDCSEVSFGLQGCVRLSWPRGRG